jgi:hypothetical protein
VLQRRVRPQADAILDRSIKRLEPDGVLAAVGGAAAFVGV